MDRYVTDIKNGCYQNPVLPMDFSDPDAIRVGEDYYLISSSFTYLPGVPVLHSKDLVHWERIGNCVERLPFDRYAQPAHGCGTWAPALRYHAGRFYAFIPLPDEGIFYTEATDPAGPWSALHCVKSASGWIRHWKRSIWGSSRTRRRIFCRADRSSGSPSQAWSQ